jgi:peptidoglycan/LPS O-acetylase OafA/YrhL
MLYHYTYRGWSFGDKLSDVAFPELAPYFYLGFLGVDLFFIISGFVILMSIGGRSPAAFINSRIVRLYPTYWFCLTISTLIIVLVNDPRFTVNTFQFLVNLSMFQGAFNVPDVEGVYWTLFVELRFYALMFLVLVLGQSRQMVPILYGWLALTAYQFWVERIPVLHFFLIPKFAAYFIAGAAFFLQHQRGPTLATNGLLLGSYLLAMAWIAVRTDVGDVMAARVVVSLFFLIFVGVARGWFANMASPRFLILGALTYPLYLVHETIGYMIFNATGGWNRFLVLGVAILSVLGLASLIVQFVEKPVSRPLKARLNQLFALILPRRLHEVA